MLNIFPDQLSNLALCRLACLVRATASDSEDLVETWNSFSQSDRSILTDHLLGDGIQSTAFIFVFLPDFFGNVKTNRVLGLGRGISVLIDILFFLQESAVEEQSAQKAIRVGMYDVSQFAARTKCPRIFAVVSRNLEIVQVQGIPSTYGLAICRMPTWL